MVEASASFGPPAPLRYGMIGGGAGAFIGEVHRKAIALDGSAALVAGCFSRSYENTLATGRALGLGPDRLYRTYEDLAEAESRRPDGIDFAVIVTPNDQHFGAARDLLARGIHVVCDKPLALDVAQAEQLAALAREKGLLFGVTYTYAGYPAVRQAREMIAAGELGPLRFVNAEYPQEWLATPLERTGHRQASWRADPARSGPAGCLGDIGTHVENLVARMTGLRIARLAARLDTLVPGRVLDDNASILLEYEGGARGVYWASQVAVGCDNGLRVRIFGAQGALTWCQEDPDHLLFARLGQPTARLSRGRDPFHPAAQGMSRIPAGHPEGYFEAFANFYRSYAATLARRKAGEPAALEVPTVEDGLSGMRFVEACVRSSRQGAAWVEP